MLLLMGADINSEKHWLTSTCNFLHTNYIFEGNTLAHSGEGFHFLGTITQYGRFWGKPINKENFLKINLLTFRLTFLSFGCFLKFDFPLMTILSPSKCTLHGDGGPEINCHSSLHEMVGESVDDSLMLSSNPFSTPKIM